MPGFEDALALAKRQAVEADLERKKRTIQVSDNLSRRDEEKKEQERLRVESIKENPRWKEMVRFSQNKELVLAIKAWWEKFSVRGTIQEIVEEVKPHSLIEMIATLRLETVIKNKQVHEKSFEESVWKEEYPDSMHMAWRMLRRTEEELIGYDSDISVTRFHDYVVIDGAGEEIVIRLYEDVHDQGFKGGKQRYGEDYVFAGGLEEFLDFVIKRVV